ncbi:MAG: hypothetical protein O3B95_03285 [Chloroflexi bacterium]|nr:hypothetical protein [Chloroflexota bacterium]
MHLPAIGSLRGISPKLIAIVTALAFVGMVANAVVRADVTPNNWTGELAPGESVDIKKTVEVPDIPENPDIYFLADTTGSMGSVINVVKTDISSVISHGRTADGPVWTW